MIQSLSKRGIQGLRVTVEVDYLPKAGGLNIVGLPAREVKESGARIESAIRKSDFDWPRGRITVNLVPSDVPKEGISLELPIALAILEAAGQASFSESDQWICIGALGLDGRLERLRGVLAMCSALKAGEKLLGPKANEKELGLVRLLPKLLDNFVGTASTLEEAVIITSGKRNAELARPEKVRPAVEKGMDFRDIIGQNHARFALEVAAAGGHNVLMVGPQGFGKTSLATAMVTILPKLSEQEQLELTAIYSALGQLEEDGDVVVHRPFVRVGHGSSRAGLVAGGQGPGQITLAHKGVLFLDEINRFRSDALEALREPMENGEISIAFAKGTMRYPCQFTLIAAMNPCPCGKLGEYECMKCKVWVAGTEVQCPNCGGRRLRDLCSDPPSKREKFRERISRLMDRIDIEVMVHSVGANEKLTRKIRDSSKSIRKRVEAARQLQAQRYAGTKITCNAFVPGGAERVREYCEMNPSGEALFEKLIRTMDIKLSIRRECKLLKVARTIADLDEQKKTGEKHIVQAASLIGRDLGGIIRTLAPDLYSSAAVRSAEDDIAKGIRDLKKALD